MLAPRKKSYDQPRQPIKKQRYHFANKHPHSQSNDLQILVNVYTVVLEKTVESSLDCKEIKPVNPKGNQPQIFIGRTDAEVEALILWPPDVKS